MCGTLNGFVADLQRAKSVTESLERGEVIQQVHIVDVYEPQCEKRVTVRSFQGGQRARLQMKMRSGVRMGPGQNVKLELLSRDVCLVYRYAPIEITLTI